MELERHTIEVEGVAYGDLILEAKADDTHIVYAERVYGTYTSDDERSQIVVTESGYARYNPGQIVTVLRGIKW